MSKSTNKRIMKNTLMLYIRMFVTMAISLYASRIVLASLGEVDFGIYNVVGGIVVMFGVLTNSLATSTQRFLNFSSGKDILSETKKVFSMSLIIHIMLAIIILIAGETIGLWFLNNKLNIPAERMDAAQWVYQFSLLASITSIIRVPYNAAIIANEKMSIYAYISIGESILKLLIVYLLVISENDLLVLYGTLVFIAQLIIFVIYAIICTQRFLECRFTFVWELKLLKTMLSYSGWNTIGGLAGILTKEGVNIMLNIFFGPTVNAARGISSQVSTAVRGFSNNLQLAVNPQIVKLYASGKRTEMFVLIIDNAKYAFFLISILAIPFILEINFILDLWLKKVPDHTEVFTQIMLLQSMFFSLHLPLGMGVHAHGKMKVPNLTTSIIYLSILPISYVLLKLGLPEKTPFIIMLLVEPITISIDLIILKKFISFPVKDFLKMVVKSILIILIALPIPIFIHVSLDFGWFRFATVLVSSVLGLSFAVYKWGITNSVRHAIITKIKSYFT